jgi:predicted DNA binding CopG/RHH family protein
MGKVKIPTFKSYEEEAAWWDSHDLTEIEGLKPVNAEVFIQGQTIAIRLQRTLMEQLQRLADQQGVKPTTLVHQWIIQQLQRRKS